MIGKPALRAQVRDRLRSTSRDERRLWGDHIAANLWSVPEVWGARAILLFASLPYEVPTAIIDQQARDRGIAVAYPRCLIELNQLSLHAVSSYDDLRPGPYGIPEPAPDCPPIAPTSIDVVLLPGLAWDRAGHRLGRGAGYYDRLLAAPDWSPYRCGLFFALQEVPAIPPDPWDVPLHAVVTEAEVVAFH